MLGVRQVANHSNYLGLLVVFGRSKKEIFSFVVERVWKKLKGLKEKVLSGSGREILIKSVVQDIPSFIMSCYKLFVGVCDQIEKMIARF